MIGCRNLTVRAPNSGTPILDNAEAVFEPHAMNAVIGPSGCGKTTLVKAMLRIFPSSGDVYFGGEKVDSGEELVGRVGFAPQFTCVHPMLTVREALESAFDIAVEDSSNRDGRIDEILKIVGLDDRADTLVGSLSGGQLRRIGLAVELVNDPATMVCDEVTSGLDPLSENSILDLLQSLSRGRGKTFICIIHNLAKLDYFERVTVVFGGGVVFQGTPDELKKYFEIDTPLSLYDRLNDFDAAHWRKKWNAAKPPFPEADLPEAGGDGTGVPCKRPGFSAQLFALLLRRWKLFFRDSTYLLLTLGITFGFPLVVVVFSIGGLPQIESLALDRSLGALDELRENLKFQIGAANTSAIVTGLILFQVVLLSLIGANNSAREIAGERNLYEKERLIGLRPSAYALSKVLFTSALAVFQGVWMCGFVKYVCGFPGAFAVQAAELSLVCVAMTAICLAFSSIFSSSDKANLVSIYLVGFQLPLSGVVLALPEALKWVCRPFIGTYWGWAGYMSSMKHTRIYDAYIQTKPDWEFVPSPSLAAAVLLLHFAAAAAVVFWGCKTRKWN